MIESNLSCGVTTLLCCFDQCCWGCIYTRLHRLCCYKIKSNDSPLLHFLKWHRPTSTLGSRPEHGTFIRASPPVLTQKGWYCFVTNKTIKIYLSQNKFIEAWQRQTPRIFNSFTIIFQVKMRRASKPVVFNLFHAETHFSTQFNLMTPFRKFLARHMKCSCVCTIENHNDYKITYDITVLNQDSFVKFMHMAASERDPWRTQITPQHNALNTRIKTPLAAAIRYLIYKHITFLRHKVIRALPNATVFCTVMVIITLKTILNEDVGYHFCQVILLFWLRQKVVP